MVAVSNADEYWLRLCRKTPRLAGDGSVKMTLTIAEFRKAVVRAYERGEKNGAAGANARPAQPEILDENEGDFSDILRRMFGGRN